MCWQTRFGDNENEESADDIVNEFNNKEEIPFFMDLKAEGWLSFTFIFWCVWCESCFDLNKKKKEKLETFLKFYGSIK